MSKEKEETLINLTTKVAQIEGFNIIDALLIAKTLCSKRDRISNEYSLPGLIPLSTSQTDANSKRAEDMGDPEIMILEIKNKLSENYTKEELLNILKTYL